MITFYKHEKCALCDAFEEKFIDIVLAHKIRLLGNENAKELSLKDAAIVEGETITSGHSEISLFVSDITKAMIQWQKFQSDACYISDDDTDC